MPSLPLLRDTASGRLRTVYREIVVRFDPVSTPPTGRRSCDAPSCSIRRTNPFVDRQFVLYDPRRRRVGLDLLDAANALAGLDEVSFAVPNFVTRVPAHRRPRSHRPNGICRTPPRVAGQRAGEDINALEAWQVTRGRPSVVVAIIDDGVDVDHPNLKAAHLAQPGRGRPGPVRT